MKRSILGAQGGTAVAKVFFLVVIFMAAMINGDGATGGRAESIELRPGQEKLLKGAGVRVRLVAVEEDSRCPEGVNCIWAGNVRVALLVKGPGRAQRREALNTATEPRELKLNGRTVTISKVFPAKVVEREIKPGGYRITLSLAPRD
jgi:hypothetical protein